CAQYESPVRQQPSAFATEPVAIALALTEITNPHSLRSVGCCRLRHRTGSPCPSWATIPSLTSAAASVRGDDVLAAVGVEAHGSIRIGFDEDPLTRTSSPVSCRDDDEQRLALERHPLRVRLHLRGDDARPLRCLEADADRELAQMTDPAVSEIEMLKPSGV